MFAVAEHLRNETVIQVQGKVRERPADAINDKLATGRVEVRKVTVGMESANYAEIKSGVSEGEMVVIGNRSQLTAGEIVTALIFPPVRWAT